MLWQKLDATAQSILLNWQELMFECIQHTDPDKNYYAERQSGDFYYMTQVLFPLMNGVISFASDPRGIRDKCKQLKDRFKEKNYPIT